jgi:sugar phosphate isomerase/epimerase
MKSAPFSYTRRELLFGLAGAALAFPKARNSMYNPELAAHTSVWLEEAERRHIPIAEILDEALTGTRDAGYGRIELVSEFLNPELKNRTLRLLERRKLEPSIVYASGPLYERAAGENSRRQIKETAWLMMGHGTRFLNFSPAPKPNEAPKTAMELETEAYQLNRMGQELGQAGLDLLVHHDQAEMRENAREWRYLLAHTEAGLVSFCLDIDCVARAGIRPVSLMDTAGGRLRSLHLRNPKNGVNQELLREGDINMFDIARFLRQMSFDGFLVVELLHDQSTPRRYPLATDLSLSRWYMQEVFGTRPGNPPVDMGPHVRKNT